MEITPTCWFTPQGFTTSWVGPRQSQESWNSNQVLHTDDMDYTDYKVWPLGAHFIIELVAGSESKPWHSNKEDTYSKQAAVKYHTLSPQSLLFLLF